MSVKGEDCWEGKTAGHFYLTLMANTEANSLIKMEVPPSFGGASCRKSELLRAVTAATVWTL